MKSEQFNIKAKTIRWKQFARHSDSVFLSLKREISIGVLSVSTLLAATPASAVGKVAMSDITGESTTELYADEDTIADTSPFDINLLEQGDLLFNVEADAKGIAAAIVNVTEGIDLQNISHVAIVYKHDNQTYALEASGKHGVWLNPVDSFFTNARHTQEGKPLILVGRLKDRSNIKESINNALTYIGRPYDKFYMPDDTEIYCSELVQLSFVNPDGSHIFPQIPMSFHDKSGKVTDFWTEYYKKYGMEVPEGKPGTNPGGISRSDAIEIIYKLY